MTKITIKNKITLRKHQTKAVNAINKSFETNNKCLVKMFCGTGKTRLVFYLMMTQKNNLSIIVFPSISLITQFNIDYLHKEEWMKIKAPDVLMLPIGGAVGHNTMNEREALQAVRIIKPKLVIPCHYNCPFLWHKQANPADVKFFKEEVEKLGAECVILRNGESIDA